MEILVILVRRRGATLPSNLGNLAHLARAPLARRLVYLSETKIARLLGNLGRNLGLKGKLVGETKIARLCGNLGQIIVLNPGTLYDYYYHYHHYC